MKQMEHEKDEILEATSVDEIEIPVVSETLDPIPMTPMSSRNNSVCRFSIKEKNACASNESVKKLSLLILFYTIIMIVELIGGLKARSIAVISDAAHLLSDIAGFAISLFAVWASGWEAAPRQSFGYNRLETCHRNASVNGKLVFAIATFGFVLNCIMVLWLGHDHTHHHGFGGSDHCHGHGHDHSHHQCGEDFAHDHEMEELPKIIDEENLTVRSNGKRNTSVLNINIQVAYLHVMTDMIQSIGVMIAGGIIWAKPKWVMVDLLCTLIFSVISLSTTMPMLKKIVCILMERTPSEINIIQFENGLRSIKGVPEVHDLHVWAVTVGILFLSCHVVAEPGINSIHSLDKIKHYCENTYQIQHVTIQIE
ncbi:unnamed protein product [Trifolium pratense]|uniref:Uncharacterized protein n=1 Tax=Trifolium pratense TaxID=57577 RepID=A0ACB0ME47_TRIPR|nr:unnamed protein product [Trifolium pratense]